MERVLLEKWESEMSDRIMASDFENYIRVKSTPKSCYTYSIEHVVYRDNCPPSAPYETSEIIVYSWSKDNAIACADAMAAGLGIDVRYIENIDNFNAQHGEIFINPPKPPTD